jgi:hypothetical protein
VAHCRAQSAICILKSAIPLLFSPLFEKFAAKRKSVMIFAGYTDSAWRAGFWTAALCTNAEIGALS